MCACHSMCMYVIIVPLFLYGRIKFSVSTVDVNIFLYYSVLFASCTANCSHQ